MTQMLELAYEVLKTAIVKIFKDAQGKMVILNKQMSISKEINQMDILEIKSKCFKLYILES